MQERERERASERYPFTDENLSEIPLFEPISKICCLAERGLVWRHPPSLRAQIFK